MKQRIPGFIWWLATAVVLMTAGRTEATGYLLFTGGGGGSADAHSVGLEGGWKLPGYSLGLGVAAVASDEVTGQGSIHSGQGTVIGQWTQERGEELEVHGTLGVALVGQWSLVGSAGIAERLTTTTWHTSSGSFEFEPDETEYRFAYGLYLQTVSRRLMLRAGYHNRRGIVAGVGFTFR